MVQRKASLPVIPQRKPIRPIERQKMRPWLVNLLNNERITGFSWVSKDHETFRISWRHAARQGWDPEVDAGLFERWAKHTGTSVYTLVSNDITTLALTQVYFLYSLLVSSIRRLTLLSFFYFKWVLMNSSVINLCWFCLTVGKYVDGDEPDPKRWKANFRCALNSLPDVKQLKDQGQRKGKDAYKVYQFLNERKSHQKHKATGKFTKTR